MTVALDKPAFKGGESMTGRVGLRITDVAGLVAHSFITANPEVEQALELKLRFVGYESVQMSKWLYDHKVKMKRRHDYTSSRTIYSHIMTVARFEKEQLATGDFVFPFSIELPTGLPAGFSYELQESAEFMKDSHAKVVYDIQTILTRAGDEQEWGMTIDKSPRIGVLIEDSSAPTAAVPKLIAPKTEQISSFFGCFNSGKLHAGASVENVAVANGETIKAKLVVENHSSAKLKAVEVTLWEEVRASATGFGYMYRQKRTMKHTMRLPAEQLGALSKAKTESLTDADVLRRVSSALSGESEGISISIPVDNCNNYYGGRNVQVRHILEIKMPAASSTPTIECPIFVQGQGRANAHELPYEQAASPPADWFPRQIDATPAASSATVTVGKEYLASPETDQERASIQGLLDSLDASFPALAAETVGRWFSDPANSGVKSLSPAALASIVERVVDNDSKAAVAEILSTHVQQITVDHLIAVATATVPIDANDASLFGVRWAVLGALAKVCTADSNNAVRLVEPLNSNCEMIYTEEHVAKLFEHNLPKPPPR